MTPDQFQRQVQKQPEGVYLFLGPEQWRRSRCRAALLDKMLPGEERESGFIRHDLEEVTLAEVIDDARSMSLFAANRVIWVASAEAAMPRGRAAESESSDAKSSGETELAQYCKDPAPGVALVFDAARFDFDGEDKTKIERVRKFYAAVSNIVEFARPAACDARLIAQDFAAERQLKIGAAELDLLVEATGGDPQRTAIEMDKLALYRGAGGKVLAEDIATMVPNARETTIFALVNAIARADRKQSLDLLDTLVREGEYLPLALTFLGGIFRLALAAKEQNLRSAQDVQNYFSRQGTPMWRARAEQIQQTMTRFSTEQLGEAIRLTFQTDAALKGTRPDDRTVLENFLFQLVN